MLMQASPIPTPAPIDTPPPTRPFPDLPDEPSPMPQPSDPPSERMALLQTRWRLDEWVPASG